MAGRGRTTSQKRQKEQARLERRQSKAARKEARKSTDKHDHDSDIADDQYLRELRGLVEAGQE